MKEKFDYQAMRQEIQEDEKMTKNRPVLLTQREIRELLRMRKAKNGQKGKS